LSLGKNVLAVSGVLGRLVWNVEEVEVNTSLESELKMDDVVDTDRLRVDWELMDSRERRKPGLVPGDLRGMSVFFGYE
jgi:hypothetical protein